MITVKMIQEKETGKRFYLPILCCDVCRKQIADADLALYKWQNDENKQPISDTFVILHKGPCDDMHNRCHNAEDWPWDEVRALLGRLINNAEGQGKLSVDIWKNLVERYCPSGQLEDVQRIAESIIEYPANRPPSMADLP